MAIENHTSFMRERKRERDTHSVLIITYTFSFNSVQRFRAILTRTRTLDCSCQNMVSLIPGFDLIQILYCKPRIPVNPTLLTSTGRSNFGHVTGSHGNLSSLSCQDPVTTNCKSPRYQTDSLDYTPCINGFYFDNFNQVLRRESPIIPFGTDVRSGSEDDVEASSVRHIDEPPKYKPLIYYHF